MSAHLVAGSAYLRSIHGLDPQFYRLSHSLKCFYGLASITAPVHRLGARITLHEPAWDVNVWSRAEFLLMTVSGEV